MQKRIAFISMHTCPLAFEEGKETGGMNVYVMELARALAAKNIIVDVYTRIQSDKSEKIVTVSKNFRVIHLDGGPIHVAKKELINYTSVFAKSIAEFIQTNSLAYDLIHAHYYLSALTALALKKQHNILLPIAVTYYTLAIMKNLVARSELEKEETSRITAEKEIANSVDLIFAPCIVEKEYLHYLYGAPLDRIAIVSPGVNTTIFRPLDQKEAKAHIGADPKHKIVLFVGRIEPLKGIDTLFYAVKILKEKNPNQSICLCIVGGDKEQKPKSRELEKLKHLQKILNLETSVTFITQKSQTELPYYYNAADVVVMPSHYESFGMVALEAIACGTPVITTNVTGIATLIDKKYSKFIVPANNPLILATQIEKTLEHLENQDIKQQLTESIHNFTWENVAKKISQAYNNLL